MMSDVRRWSRCAAPSSHQSYPLFTFAPRVFAVSRSNVTVSSGDNSVLSMPRGRSSGVIVAKFQVAPWKSGTFHGVRATFQDSAFGDACSANKPRLTATTATTECLAIVDLRSTQGTPLRGDPYAARGKASPAA